MQRNYTDDCDRNNNRPGLHFLSNIANCRVPVYQKAIAEFVRLNPKFDGAFIINDDVTDIYQRPLGNAEKYKAIWIKEDAFTDLTEFWRIVERIDLEKHMATRPGKG